MYFFSPKKKRAGKEEEVEVDDLGGWIIEEAGSRRRPASDDIQSVGHDQSLLGQEGHFFHSPREKGGDRCKKFSHRMGKEYVEVLV